MDQPNFESSLDKINNIVEDERIHEGFVEELQSGLDKFTPNLLHNILQGEKISTQGKNGLISLKMEYFQEFSGDQTLKLTIFAETQNRSGFPDVREYIYKDDGSDEITIIGDVVTNQSKPSTEENRSASLPLMLTTHMVNEQIINKVPDFFGNKKIKYVMRADSYNQTTGKNTEWTLRRAQELGFTQSEDDPKDWIYRYR